MKPKQVNRNDDGSEVRYPVILSTEEKRFAATVCSAFKQGVCGFDILRVHGKSYVCDVNGWSFVKTSMKYFDDCAQLLSEIILSAVRERNLPSLSAIAPLTITSAGSPRVSSVNSGSSAGSGGSTGGGSGSGSSSSSGGGGGGGGSGGSGGGGGGGKQPSSKEPLSPLSPSPQGVSQPMVRRKSSR